MDNVQFKWCFLIYCSAVTLRFASSNSFASSYSFFFLLSLWPHFFYLLPNTANEARKEYGGKGRGSFVWKKQRDKKSNRDWEKQDFPDLSFQILFSFFKNQVSGLDRLYNIWPLCYLTTFWINLGFFCWERSVQNVHEFFKTQSS